MTDRFIGPTFSLRFPMLFRLRCPALFLDLGSLIEHQAESSLTLEAALDSLQIET